MIYCEICREAIFDFEYVVIVRNNPTASTGRSVEYYHLKCFYERLREKNILTFSSGGYEP
jgi:N-dimethylarginine dimethylaminohydrolase